MAFEDRFRSLKAYIGGNEKSGKVYRLVIEISNACNLRCSMCPRNLMERRIEHLDVATFESIIRENHKELEFVSLNGYGEPLLHPGLFDFLKLCGKYGVHTGISTNCTLLDEAKSAALLECPPDVLTLAIDSVDRNSFEKVRVGADFDAVMENARRFLDLHRAAGGRKKPFVILQCIYMTETRERVKEFRRAFSAYRHAAIRIRQLSFSGRGRDDADYANRQCSCSWLWTEPMVLSNGTLAPCCQDVNGRLALGSIREKSLNELWRSGRICELRREHADGRRASIPICRECNMYQPSYPLLLGAMCLNTARTNILLPSIETAICDLRYCGGRT